MTRSPSRYIIPGDVLTHMAISLMHASDALKLGAIVASHDPINLESLLTTFKVLASRLDDIQESLSAIVHENGEGNGNGSPRLC